MRVLLPAYGSREDIKLELSGFGAEMLVRMSPDFAEKRPGAGVPPTPTGASR